MSEHTYSEADKERWLSSAAERIPPGTRVAVVASDVPEYIGSHGTVADYDIGDLDTCPLVGVIFDAPVNGTVRDGFYCDGDEGDEIVPLT